MEPSVSDPAVAEIEPLYRAWLIRHELPDAYARWREADADRAPTLAFIALACDSRLLLRLGAAGDVLAAQAERFAAGVATKREVSNEARATAEVVRLRIQHWRERAASKRVPIMVKMASKDVAHPELESKTLTLDDHLRVALKDLPHYRESAARALFRETLRLGSAGLQVMGAPFDEAIMLATARYAARCCRGLIRGEVPTRDECMTAVALVQQWGARASKNPFIMDFAAVEGSLDDLILGLCRDVGTCLAIALKFPGGPLAPGFAIWEEAEEYLCYGALSLRPNQLSHMDTDQARVFAAAAARRAAAALENGATRIPAFPNGQGSGPRTVLATTRFALPNGVGPRRSVLAQVQPV